MIFVRGLLSTGGQPMLTFSGVIKKIWTMGGPA